MADPGTQALRTGPEILAGGAIPFRFEVTWRSLTRELVPTGTAAQVQKADRRTPVRDTEAKEWEMVLPRMKRPAALPPAPAPICDPSPDAEVAAPSFASGGDRRSRRWLFPAGAALLLPLALVALRWTERQSTPATETISATQEMGGAGWFSEWASDRIGSARARQISLYRPSMTMSDYRIEFVGRIERKSLGWVFRAFDSKNYYVGKLEAASGGLAITHFAVIRGVEGPHIQRALPIAAAAGTTLKVRVDASGPRFTIYVQNQVVEDWEDDRLKIGGVGFLNEREERGQVGSVRISFPKGGRQ
jgi:hypothetical protein